MNKTFLKMARRNKNMFVNLPCDGAMVNWLEFMKLKDWLKLETMVYPNHPNLLKCYRFLNFKLKNNYFFISSSSLKMKTDTNFCSFKLFNWTFKKGLTGEMLNFNTISKEYHFTNGKSILQKQGLNFTLYIPDKEDLFKTTLQFHFDENRNIYLNETLFPLETLVTLTEDLRQGNPTDKSIGGLQFPLLKGKRYVTYETHWVDISKNIQHVISEIYKLKRLLSN